MTTEFGSGIALTQDLDFSVNNAGDLDTERGVDELQKDLAFFLIEQMKDIPGRRKTSRTSAIAKSRTRSQLLADPRVNSIRGEIDVFYPNESPETLEIAATVDTVEGEQDLVFRVRQDL